VLNPNYIEHTMKVTATIEGVVIDDARMSIEKDQLFICSNKLNGMHCKDKLGYSRSWTFGSLEGLIDDYNQSINGYISHLEGIQVTELELIPTEWNTEENTIKVGR